MPNPKKLYCQIRKEWVADFPEEIVRQKVLQHLIQNLGFPPSLIAVEKALVQMPHLDQKQVPDRRVDIVAYARGIHPHDDLYPLLLVECKAIPLTQKVIKQTTGYHHFLKNAFISLVNDHQCLTGWYDEEKAEYSFIEDIPPYETLLASYEKKGLKRPKGPKGQVVL